MKIMQSSQQSFAAEVSEGVLQDFKAWQTLLDKWNARINLVSKGAMGDFWGRHALDSWQLWPLVPKTAETILDLGSGAGFPGIAMAIGLKHRNQADGDKGQGGTVMLVESAGKKANFLRAVIRELDLPASVWADRAENIPPQPYDIISARAFAPLPRLLTYAQPFWGSETIGLFLKGQTAQEELTQAEKQWTYNVGITPSRSEDLGVILKITGLEPKS